MLCQELAPQDAKGAYQRPSYTYGHCIGEAKFPWLGTNVLGRDGKPAAGMTDVHTVKAGDVTVGFFGLLAEIKSPGWGLPGTAGLIALALFFGSAYILQLASIIEIMLFLIGLGLILLEVFVIPGFGVAGISGIILVIASLSFSKDGRIAALAIRPISLNV